MARGETKLGYERLQNTGSSAAARGRGGEIIPRRMIKTVTLAGAAPATAANYGVFFTAPSIARNLEPDEITSGTKPEWEVTAFYERHATAGNDAGAVTVMLTKVPSGTAAAAGTALLTAGISLKGTADTNAIGTLSATLADLRLAPGDSLALVLTGTPTTVAHLSATVELRRI